MNAVYSAYEKHLPLVEYARQGVVVAILNSYAVVAVLGQFMQCSAGGLSVTEGEQFEVCNWQLL